MRCEECGNELTEKEEEVTSTINRNWCYHCALSKAPKNQELTGLRGLARRLTGWLKQLPEFAGALIMGGRG